MRSMLACMLLESLTALNASAQTLKWLQEGTPCFVLIHWIWYVLFHLLYDFTTGKLGPLSRNGPGPLTGLGPGYPLGKFLHSQSHLMSGKSIALPCRMCGHSREIVGLMREERLFKLLSRNCGWYTSVSNWSSSKWIIPPKPHFESQEVPDC